MSPRKPWVAAVASLCFPGLGHLYVGRPRAAVLWWLGLMSFMVSALLLSVLFPRAAAEITVGRVVPHGVLWLTQAALAWNAARSPGFVPGRANNAGLYLLFAAGTWIGGQVVAFGTRALVEPFDSPSSSMEPSIRAGDQFFTFKVGPGARLERGAIIVYENAAVGRTWVKRIIGMPGDTVRVEQGRAFSVRPCDPPTYEYTEGWNDEVTQGSAPCAIEQTWKILDTGQDRGDGTWQVPEGALFVMGDNRGNSEDSRHQGFVPLSAVIGRVGPIYWSRRPGTWIPRFDRFGVTP